MHRALIALALVLLSAVRSDATLQWFYSMDDCNSPLLASTGSTGLWSTSITGTPTLVTTGLDGDPGNLCAYNLAPASGANVYLPKSFTSDASLFAGMHIKFNTCPTTRRRILTFRDTGASKFGGMITAEASPGSTTNCILKAFYESSDVSPGECSASATMDQTECGGACTGSDISTCVVYGTPQRGDIACSSSRCINECDAANVDVGSTCAPGVYGQVTVPTGSWRSIALGQQNGGTCQGGANQGATCSVDSACPSSICIAAGSVVVSLYEGATANAQAIQRGSATRKQGKCSGGTGAAHTNGKACNVAGDCGGAGSPTCSTIDVVTIEEIRFGTDDSVAASLDYTIDALWTDNVSVLSNWRVETLQPRTEEQADSETSWNPVGTNHSCGAETEALCLKDDVSPALPDDAGSTLDHGVATRATIGIQFATPQPTSPAATPIAVSASILGEDAASGGSSSATVDIEFFETTAYATKITNLFSSFDLENNPGTGGITDPYYTLPSLVSALAPDGTSWDATDLTTMRLKLHKTAGSGNSARVGTAITDVLYRMPDPILPTVIPDRNRNGQKNVTIAGDSTWNQPALHNTLAAGLLEPTNLIECAVDGGTIGDIARDVSIAGTGNDILETAATFASGWECKAIRGSLGDTADVLIVNAWANSQHLNSVNADPAMDTGHQGLGTGTGYCDDNGGADQGNSCSCPIHSHPTIRPIVPFTYYCRVRGTNWKKQVQTSFTGDQVAQAYGCFCDTNADCKLTSGAANGTCAAIATPTAPAATRTPGNPTPKVCGTPNFTNAALLSRVTDDPPNTWFLPGCLSAPGCTNGLCIAVPNEAYMDQNRAAIQAAVAARPTNTGTLITPTPPAATPGPSAKPPLLIWALPASPLQNTSITGLGVNFGMAEQKTGKAREELKARAEAASIPWIDMSACMLRDCTGKRLGAFDPGNPFLGQNADGIDGNQTYCLKDSIHDSDIGDAVQGQCIINCLTNAQGVRDGICGPSPTAPLPTPPGRRCSQGKVNDNCTANADCDTYHCDFSAAP